MEENNRKKTSDAQLREAVANSKSVAEAIRSLGLRAVSGSYSHYSKRIKEIGCDTSHHVGTRGRPSPKRKTSAEILIKRSDGCRTDAVRLRRALIEIDRPYICEKCGQLPEWQGNTLTLDVDHINQDWMDDRAENLRFLCPNCHSQFTRGQVGALAVDKRKRSPVGKLLERKNGGIPWNKGVRDKNRSVILADDELKELIWSIPMRKLAERFGISDVSLKKECTSRGMETPDRGYWQKKRALPKKPITKRTPSGLEVSHVKRVREFRDAMVEEGWSKRKVIRESKIWLEHDFGISVGLSALRDIVLDLSWSHIV